MIVFDLDGTLANCEHRRHFVDPLDQKNIDNASMFSYTADGKLRKAIGWKPNWKAFFEACDEDTPIIQTQAILRSLWAVNDFNYIEIWSGRCESVRAKTESWLQNHGLLKGRLKMRTRGDCTPDDQLKERWLEEHIAGGGSPISMVFDDRPKVVRMWRRHGIFVFDCHQGEGEF